MAEARGAPLVEQHHVDFIPPDERHGKAADLAPFWFAMNQQALTFVTGALAVFVGLNVAWAIIAIVIGNAFGAIFMAYHSAQGPKLGIPQMIQSRAQFGFYGAFFLFLATFLVQFGFFAASVALAGGILNEFVPDLSTSTAMVILAVPIIALAILGYDWVHRWQRVATVVFGIAFAILTVMLLADLQLPAGATSLSAPAWASFLVALSIMAVYQISWGPFVSDWSRYLPEDTSVSATFWATYVPSIVSCIWLQTLGALVAMQFADTSVTGGAGEVTGKWILVVMGISLVGAAATNLYGGMLALVTTLQTFRDVKASSTARVVGILITAAVGLAFALSSHDFLLDFENFLLVLLFLFVPWSAVNLTDFYLVQKGVYDTRSFFTARGVYGGWRREGLIAYFIGLLAEIPFISQTLYTGPIAKALDGTDISWIVGLIVPAGVYLLLARPVPTVGPPQARLEPAVER
jgi:NCS1 family nucleobase:cation symporter-1